MIIVLEHTRKILALLGLQSEPVIVLKNKKMPNIFIHLLYILSMLITIIPLAQSSYETREAYNYVSSAIYVFVSFISVLLIYVDLAARAEEIADAIHFLQSFVLKSKF